MIDQKTPAQALSASRKKGFTLTEIAIVLGIIGLILGAIWTAAAAVYQNQRIAHGQTAIMQIAQGVRTLYATTGATTGLTVAGLISAAAVPADLIIPGAPPTTMSSPFPGGSTLIVPVTDGTGFEISMSGLTQASCISLLAAVGGASRDSGLSYAQSAAGAMATPATVGTPLAFAVTPALAGAAIANNAGGCTSAAASRTVSFVFSVK